MQCPSAPFPERIQDKPETTPPNKTGACTDYFAVAGVHTDINNSLPTNQQVIAGPQLRGVLAWYATDNTTNKMAHVTDGLSNTIMIGECAGREDYGDEAFSTPVAYTGTIRVRARGGAWATTDNPYEIGQSNPWHASFGAIPGPVRINNSNEWGTASTRFMLAVLTSPWQMVPFNFVLNQPTCVCSLTWSLELAVKLLASFNDAGVAFIEAYAVAWPHAAPNAHHVDRPDSCHLSHDGLWFETTVRDVGGDWRGQLRRKAN